MRAPSKVALITGCSSGIGEACATRFLEGGWKVYATGRSKKSIAHLVKAGCDPVILDVTDDASCVAGVKKVEAASGPIGALVNNAGYALHGALESLDPAELRRQFETNVFGGVRLTQLVLPGMREAGAGRVIFVGSIVGRVAAPGIGAYSGSKHALEAISDAARGELRPLGIGVSLLEPGPVKTRFAATATATMGAGLDDPVWGRFNQQVERTISGLYEGRRAAMASSAEDVAAAAWHAATSPRPRARYRIGVATAPMIAMRTLAHDELFDRVVGARFGSSIGEASA